MCKSLVLLWFCALLALGAVAAPVEETSEDAPKTAALRDSALLTEYCTEDIECENAAQNSACINNLCTCKLGFVEEDKECIGSLNAECEEDTGCSANLVCDKEKSVCKCNEGFIPSDTSCLALAKSSNDPCTVKEQCQNVAGSICKSGVCFVLKNLGETCSASEDCKSDQNLKCTEGSCRCSDGFVEEGEPKKCTKAPEKKDESAAPPVPPVAAANGDNCTKPDQVCELVDGNCICKLKEVAAGDITNATLDLPPKDALKTALSAETPAIDGKVHVGSTCNSNENCSSLENVLCKESLCQCVDNFSPAVDATKCLPNAKKLGDSCQSDRQCEPLGDKAKCTNDRCEVKPATASIGPKAGSSAHVSGVSSLSVALCLCTVFYRLF